MAVACTMTAADYYWWEMWVMTRKVLVTFVVTVVSKIGIMTEAVTGLLVVGFALTVHLVHQPYDDDVLDRLETYSLYATVITLVAGLYFLGDEIENDIKVMFVVIIFLANATFCLYFARAGYRDFKRKMVDDNLAKAARIAERMGVRKADPNYKSMVEIRTHLENKMKARTEITRHRVAIVDLKKAIAERQRRIELEERQLLLYSQREDTALFQNMVKQLAIGQANFAVAGEEESKEVVEGTVVEMHPIMLLRDEAHAPNSNGNPGGTREADL